MNNKNNDIISRLDKLCELMESGCYKYYNANPKKRKTGDCVIRAICTALDKSWDDVLKDLTEYALKYKYSIASEELYEIYLMDHKWIKHNKPCKRNKNGYILKEWLKKHGEEAIVTIDSDHLTYVCNHIVYDIWDCTEQTVGNFWTKE